MHHNYIVDRLDTWKNTKKISNKLYPNIPKSIKLNQDTIDLQFNKYQKKYKTEIIVKNIDTIDAAIILKNNKLNPLLLNMSDHKIAGGFVETGSGAQEENLFRRSNYFLTLLQDFYPLKMTDIVYSPEVTIFKKNEEKHYKMMNEPIKISMIACPALRFPQLTSNNELANEIDKKLMKDKVRMIFKTALKYNHDSLVLSAHGCGAWGCPAEEISKIYKNVINEFDGYFNLICFAILDSGKHSDKIVDTNNLSIFNKNLL